jgi:hypothetical protein
LCCVNMGVVADVSEVHAASIFKVEVSWVNGWSCVSRAGTKAPYSLSDALSDSQVR